MRPLGRALPAAVRSYLQHKVVQATPMQVRFCSLTFEWFCPRLRSTCIFVQPAAANLNDQKPLQGHHRPFCDVRMQV